MARNKRDQRPVICSGCRNWARYFYFVGDGPELERHPVYGRHYQTELEIDLDLWGADHDNYCLECEEPLHQFVLRHEALPGLCVRHLAIAMRSDEAIAVKVREAFKEDKERLIDELVSEARRESKESAKMELFNPGGKA